MSNNESQTDNSQTLRSSRRLIALAIATGLGVTFVLAHLGRTHVLGARNAAARIDSALQISEEILALGRHARAADRARSEELAEEVTLAAKAGALRESDLVSIQRILMGSGGRPQPHDKTHMLDAISAIIRHRASELKEP